MLFVREQASRRVDDLLVKIFLCLYEFASFVKVASPTNQSSILMSHCANSFKLTRRAVQMFACNYLLSITINTLPTSVSDMENAEINR